MLNFLLNDLRAMASLVLTVFILPRHAEAQGLPVNTGSHAAVALWFVGAFVLGGVIFFGIMRNRRRSRAERKLTEQATRDNYRGEGQNRRTEVTNRSIDGARSETIVGVLCH